MAPAKKYKKTAEEVDKEVAEVDRLVNRDGMSINAALNKVGLQNTVYYYRKRLEKAQEKQKAIFGGKLDTHIASNLNVQELVKKHKELEDALKEVKRQLAAALDIH